MSPSRSLTTVAIAALACACGDRAPPSCAAIERNLAAVVAADRAGLPADLARPFLPVLDAAIVDELGGRCRAGTLPAAARRCLAGARGATDVDRCVARLEAGR